MKVTLDNLKDRIIPFVVKLRTYKTFLFFVGLLMIYSFLVFRISVLTGREPSGADIDAKLQSVSRPKIDQTAVDKINQLQDNSVQVKSLFNATRDNPFHE